MQTGQLQEQEAGKLTEVGRPCKLSVAHLWRGQEAGLQTYMEIQAGAKSCVRGGGAFECSGFPGPGFIPCMMQDADAGNDHMHGVGRTCSADGRQRFSDGDGGGDGDGETTKLVGRCAYRVWGAS